MLTLFHDYTSPGSAVAVRRLQRLADQGLPVGFEGFDAVGLDIAVPVTGEVQGAVDELRDEAARAGITLRRPRFLPPTGRAHAVGAAAERDGLGASWREVCYRAFWSEGADVADPAVLEGLADAAGLDPDAARAVLADAAAVAEVRRRTTRHRREGVGGVPTILAQFGAAGPPLGGGGLGYAGTLVPGLLSDDDLRALAEL